MLDPVGRGVRVKGFDAESFETVPQLAVFCTVITMQPGMMRIFNGIPSVNPASVSHIPCLEHELRQQCVLHSIKGTDGIVFLAAA